MQTEEYFMKKAHKLLCKTLPCFIFALLLIGVSGCSKISKKEDADLRETLQDAMKKTKGVSAVHIEGTQEMVFETTDTLENKKEKVNQETYTYSVLADYYTKDKKINYYGITKDSTGYEVTLVIKDNKGLSFTTGNATTLATASSDELDDFSQFNPFELYLNEIWIGDTEEYSTYTSTKDGEDTIISIEIEDLDGLNDSENEKYQKAFNSEIEYYDFKLLYTINKKGYISKVECETRSDSVEKSSEGEDLGYEALVIEIKEKAKDKSVFYFSNFNKEVQLDFSLLDPILKKTAH